MRSGISWKDISISVCSAFNNCVTARKSVELMLHFNVNNKHNLESFSVLLSLNLLESIPYELIIGRRDIIKHDLWNKTLVPELLEESSKIIVPKVQIVKTKSSIKTLSLRADANFEI